MIKYPKTHEESGKYYAVIYNENGDSYYIGGFNNRSKAYRVAVKRQSHDFQFREDLLVRHGLKK